MKLDVILAGVGEHGLVSVATLLAAGALRAGWRVRQAAGHAPTQRTGASKLHLRLAAGPIDDAHIPRRTADLVLGLEPLETLRYLSWLAPDGGVLSATEPRRNLANYPEPRRLLETLATRPGARLLDAGRVAREAGLPGGAGVVLAGAGSTYVPIEADHFEQCLREAFQRRGEPAVEAHLRAFRAGREAVLCTV